MKATYNKSEIFKSAWVLVKSTGKTISESLKSAWAKVKAAASNVKKLVSEYFGEITFLDMIMGTGRVEAKLWEKKSEGKCRVYFKIYWLRSSPIDCGYLDMVSKKSYLSSNPVSVARNLQSELSF